MSDIFSNEIPICSIILKSENKNTSRLSPSSLVNYNNFLWINPEARDYLKTRQSIQNSHFIKRQGLEDLSDWEYLYRAIQAPDFNKNREILEFFARKSTYQLRYRKHEGYAISFVENLLQSYSRLLPSRKLWNSNVDGMTICNFQNLFQRICSETRQATAGGIYRLYDLCDGFSKNAPFVQLDTAQFKLHHLLSLLFALGEGNLNYLSLTEKQRVRSVPQLVARYKFFLKLCEDTLDRYKKNSSPSNACKQSDDYLQSQEGFEFAKKMWECHLNASTSLDHLLVKNLESSIQSIADPSQGYGYSSSCLSVDVEAHSFTFPDKQNYSSISSFPSFERRNDPSRQASASLDSYLKTVSNVVQKGTLDRSLFSPRIDQFGSGDTYTFRKNDPGNTYQVLAKILSDQIVFQLMLLPNFISVSENHSYQMVQPAQVLIIRHAEKPKEADKPKEDEHLVHLSEYGDARAKALVGLFTTDPRFLEYGTPVAIYAQAVRKDPTSSQLDPTSSRRPIETVEPLAKKLGLKLIDTYLRDSYKDMVDEIKNNTMYNGKSVLISWGHKVLADIANEFGVKELKWPKAFDRVWKISFLPNGKILFEELLQNVDDEIESILKKKLSIK